MESITSALGAGAGLDTKALVAGLVEAQFAAKTKTLTARKETLSAQISALSELRSGLTGFSTALSNLVSGGSLSTQPVSADPSVLKVSLLPGASLGELSASLEVRQLATAQAVTSGLVADRTAAFGKGTLTITLGTMAYTGDVPTGFTPKAGATPVTVTIGDADNSLNGIAAAINAASAGVTATVITDATGSRISVKGATGDEQAFTIDVTEDATAPGLSALAFNTTTQAMSSTSKSRDALVALDGVQVRRPSNSFSDLIPGVKVDLVKEAVGQSIALTTSRPTAALAQAVNDFVETYNQLYNIAAGETRSTTGVLRSDQGVKDMMRQLGAMTGLNLNSTGASNDPTTLAQLGIRTNRDGTLSVDAATLQAAVTTSGAAVEKIMTSGLTSALRNVSLALTSSSGGISASMTGYTRQQSEIAKDEEQIARQTETLRERLTRQYASMDARVNAYKATQTFLDQQIKSWTRDA